MKTQINFNSYQEYKKNIEQALSEQFIYEQVENCIKTGNLNRLKQICTEHSIDFTYDDGMLGVLAASEPEILSFMCEHSPYLIKNHGVEIITAAVWAHNIESTNFMKDQKVDVSSLIGTNVYDYYVEMSGENNSISFNNEIKHVGDDM